MVGDEQLSSREWTQSKPLLISEKTPSNHIVSSLNGIVTDPFNYLYLMALKSKLFLNSLER
jgi:hypothetical protein